MPNLINILKVFLVRLSTYNQSLYLTRSTKYLVDFSPPHPSSGWKFLRIAIPAKNLNGIRGYLHSYVGGEPLCMGGFKCGSPSSVQLRRGFVSK